MCASVAPTVVCGPSRVHEFEAWGAIDMFIVLRLALVPDEIFLGRHRSGGKLGSVTMFDYTGRSLRFIFSRHGMPDSAPYRLAAKMRKRTKKKQRSCAMCKPHKMCWSCRWNYKDLAGLKEWERQRSILVCREVEAGESRFRASDS